MVIGALRRANAVIMRRPFAFAVGFSTVKAGSADVFTQTVIEGKQELDHPRIGTFVLFGCLYSGTFQYLLWNMVFERLWPGASVAMNLSKIAATNLISDPVFFFPAFYIIREALATEAADLRSSVVVPNALRKYQENIWQDVTMGWSVWVPGHVVTYFLLPIHLRLPWVATASFSYLSLLSYLRGSETQGNEERAAAAPAEPAATLSRAAASVCIAAAQEEATAGRLCIALEE